MNSILKEYIQDVIGEFSLIAPERKNRLLSLAEAIKEVWRKNDVAEVVFICTHNSRRSHFGQVWAQCAASYYGLEDRIDSYSGGTEATAFNPRAVEALKRAGMLISSPGSGDNPLYEVRVEWGGTPIRCYSKKFDDPANPAAGFVAVMTCSDADENCPFIPGVSSRISLTYEDPKISDGTPEEQLIYDQRCRQISRELFYALSLLH